MAQRHGVAAPAAGDALELAVVLRDFRQRHLGLDDDEVARQHLLADDAAALGGQVARDVADVLGGDRDLDVHDRLQQGGLGLLHRVDERALARRPEGDFLRVHRVILAVGDRDLDVLHRESPRWGRSASRR